MQIVKWTGWTQEYIEDKSLDEVTKLAKWAYNQEVAERENIYSVMQWHLGSQDKKARGRVQKNLKNSMKKLLYNDKDPEQTSKEMINMLRGMNPQGFDKYIEKITTSNKN